MRTVVSISACLTLLAVLPAAGQAPVREKKVVIPASAARVTVPGRRVSDLMGGTVTFRDGKASGTIVDLVTNDNGAITSAIVRADNELVTVPWAEIRFQPRAVPERALTTLPRTQLLETPRLERTYEIEGPPAPPVVATISRPVVYWPRDLRAEPRTGDPVDDYLLRRFGYHTVPGWRPADLLRDRWEARRAPPLRPLPRP
jgi:hypothetical protein